MNGYAGRILRVDLSTRKITHIPTKKYEPWGGGHGMGSAIFFDLVKDKTIDGFDPGNVVTIMTSPLTGTLVPAAAGRTEVQGIGVQSHPIGWFTRSNFGGRFSAMLKFAGWDGIVIEGKADRPVWLDIRNDKVAIQDAGPLWGRDTRETQQKIWGLVTGGQDSGDWMDPGPGETRESTTQKPAVLTIGPAGENLSRLACLIHDAGNAAGQGGFGAVWGSKNLKAISVIGTGAIKVHDPKGLMAARLWQKAHYAFDLEHLKTTGGSFDFQSPPVPITMWRGGRPRNDQRPQACLGCHSGCRGRYDDAAGNEVSCFPSVFYWDAKSLDIQRRASDLLNRHGLNAVELIYGLLYLTLMNRFGLLTRSGIPDCPLDFSDLGSLEFVEQFLKMMTFGDDGKGGQSAFGRDVSQGFVRAAEKWGCLGSDLATGILMFPYWGLPIHKEPRAQVYWGYGTILGDRDINEHDLDWIKWDASLAKVYGRPPILPAAEVVKVVTDKMVPYQGDTRMLDFSESNIYSEHMAKLVSWHRYYTRFWKQSLLFCDTRWPDFVNLYAPDKIGSTGEAEPKFFNAVTGNNFSFLDGINLGRKIWNLDQAIWTLQGRHRDMVHFADFIYTKKGIHVDLPEAYMPGMEDGVWDYYNYTPRTLDRKKFDEFKTIFYRLQGWDPESGYPTRATLDSLGLGYVAAELDKKGKLGRPGT
ncbi:MAG: aldehyde ferredoxin oxidoreductase [Proteobacteria bacterium]|nr:aldehyde ferredoxin oxidoreductase [Pseudomonadota bacterium]